MTNLVVYLQTLLKPDSKHISKNSHVPLLQRLHGAPQGWCALLPVSSPRQVTWPWSGTIKTPFKYTWEHFSFSLPSFTSLKFTTKAQTLDFDSGPLAHPTNCSHFVLICRTVDQKWGRLNNCSVLKWLCIGKGEKNRMLSIFFTQISQSGKKRANKFLCYGPGNLLTAKGIYKHLWTWGGTSCWAAF